MYECYWEEHVSGLHRIGARPNSAIEFVYSFDTRQSIRENAEVAFQQRWYGDVKHAYAMDLTRHFGRRFRVDEDLFLQVRRYVLSIEPVRFPLINHFFMLLSDPLYRWGALDFVAPRYAQGRGQIISTALLPALRPHLPETIGMRTALRYGQSILTALRDNGILAGIGRKTVTPPELPVEHLAFFLYYHATCGIGVAEFEKTPLFTSLLRPPEYFAPLFREGERRGFWRFSGDSSRLSADLLHIGLGQWLDSIDIGVSNNPVGEHSR